MNSVCLLKFKKGRKREMREKKDSEQKWSFCRERRSDLSLEIRAIRSSKVVRPRRKDALRGVGYAWTPVL